MYELPDHPDIAHALKTGYPRGVEEPELEYCCECGREIEPDEDVYSCVTHNLVCEDCLKMLHKIHGRD